MKRIYWFDNTYCLRAQTAKILREYVGKRSTQNPKRKQPHVESKLFRRHFNYKSFTRYPSYLPDTIIETIGTLQTIQAQITRYLDDICSSDIPNN